jgi:hypothetical protein
MKQTAVEFLADKYNYITWLRNRDEISAGTADEWRKKFLEEAKEMEKCQIEDAYIEGLWGNPVPFLTNYQAEQYYNETFNSKDKDELQDDWDVTLNDGIED